MSTICCDKYYKINMARPKLIKLHLLEKRYKLIWELDYQGYNGEEIGFIFNCNRSTIFAALRKKPKNVYCKKNLK